MPNRGVIESVGESREIGYSKGKKFTLNGQTLHAGK
ncbi:hypothetical protein PB1_08352 [Bacillus methanolicus PB1]|uniref:Uncharacterized protein n=1 Tax=Bacillus methanolicus PB1 TaxID=997296 RepID=I3E1I7_BACMT|nr:hypothetical protein PB1_08352 [Bacillus methanolicus PB1]